MRLPTLPADGRPLAVGLLVLVLVLIYFLGIHWWFVSPQLAIGEQMDDLREQHQRFAAIVAEKPEIDKRLAQVRNFAKSNPAFLAEDDPAAAAAGLIQRVNSAVQKRDPDGGRCTVQQSTPMRNQPNDEPYEKVSVRIRMSCDMETTTGVLYDLEEGKPFLFLDELMIYQRSGFVSRGGKPTQSSDLQVQFTLSGYLRRPTEGKKA